jgi:hypothetical protein
MWTHGFRKRSGSPPTTAISQPGNDFRPIAALILAPHPLGEPVDGLGNFAVMALARMMSTEEWELGPPCSRSGWVRSGQEHFDTGHGAGFMIVDLLPSPGRDPVP